MTDLRQAFPCINKGNITNVKNLIMSVEEFNLARIEALENRVEQTSKVLGNLMKDLERGFVSEKTLEDIKLLCKDRK